MTVVADEEMGISVVAGVITISVGEGVISISVGAGVTGITEEDTATL